MKNIHFISLFVLTILLGCSSDDSSNINLDGISAPTNIAALTTVTQDNTGKVTFLPKGEGVTQYKINYGDGSPESDYFSAGGTTTHIYKEGVYQSKIIAMGINGKTIELSQEVIVSFKAPENLVVVIANDLSVSKKVTVKATADYALFYDVYFGEEGKSDPISANNGASVSYTYKEAGVYTIRVVSKSAAIKTTEHSEEVTAKLVLNPTSSAPTPPNRPAGNVISIFSSKYNDIAGTNFNPNWGQSGSLTEFDLSGDKMLNYTNLNYQGIALADGVTVDVSGMDYIHLDVWTADLEKLETSLISITKVNGERPVTKDLIANQWTSIDIPISAFTSQNGFTVADIFQLKIVGTPAGKNVFIDNIYFYKDGESLSTPAPTPTKAATDVISMFSDAYTNVAVATWRTDWSVATLEETAVAGNAVKKYSDLNYVGVEPVAPIDASAMTHFHVDVWSSDFTEFRIKLVDFGANGVYNGAGSDDVEYEVKFTAPAQGTWVSLDIPLSNFTGLTTRAHIAQLIYSGNPSGSHTIYVDNVYFHK